MNLINQHLVRMCDGKQVPIFAFGNKKVHAVAAIGNPQRFFLNLQNAGFAIERHVFTDHYLYQKDDLEFGDDRPIIMTEKDAIKCEQFADERYWYLPVSVNINAAFEPALLNLLEANNEISKSRVNAVAITSVANCHRRDR